MNIITSLGNNIKLPVVNSLPTNLDEGTLCVYQDKLYVGDGDNLPVIAGEEVDLTAEIGGLTAKNVVVTGDTMVILDSQSGNTAKKVLGSTLTNYMASTLASTFQPRYAAEFEDDTTWGSGVALALDGIEDGIQKYKVQFYSYDAAFNQQVWAERNLLIKSSNSGSTTEILGFSGSENDIVTGMAGPFTLTAKKGGIQEIWDGQPFPTTSNKIDVAYSEDLDIIVVSGSGNSLSSLAWSDDGGVTFNAAISNPNSSRNFTSIFWNVATQKFTAFASSVTTGDISVSSTDGKNWVADVTHPTSSGGIFYRPTLDYDSGDIWVVATGRIMNSTDGGDTFTSITTAPDGNSLSILHKVGSIYSGPAASFIVPLVDYTNDEIFSVYTEDRGSIWQTTAKVACGGFSPSGFEYRDAAEEILIYGAPGSPANYNAFFSNGAGYSWYPVLIGDVSKSIKLVKYSATHDMYYAYTVDGLVYSHSPIGLTANTPWVLVTTGVTGIPTYYTPMGVGKFGYVGNGLTKFFTSTDNFDLVSIFLEPSFGGSQVDAIMQVFKQNY